jgi:signal transduction histidine kinase/CheY-like chemotaxis protein
MRLHRLILKQIKTHLLDADLEENSDLIRFIESVSDDYHNYDVEHLKNEEITVKTQNICQNLTTTLTKEQKLREQSLEALLSAISTLEDDPEELWCFDTENLLTVAEYLEYHVDRIKGIENQLNVAMDEAKKSEIAKSEFLSVMSHEIRSPLNVIVGMAHIFEKEEHTSEQQENIDVLSISANNLLLLINDILDFSKIESGNLELENCPFNFKMLLSNVQKSNSLSAKTMRNRIVLKYDDSLGSHYFGDGGRIGQILTNLVSNAIKFTKGGLVEIEAIKLDQKEDGTLIRLGVKDTGIGISPSGQQKIFKKFQQAKSTITSEYGGTGLGLAITKDLLNIMDSQISIQSQVGEGSYFYFDLLLKESKSEPIMEFVNPLVENLAKAKLLIVDDQEYNILILKKILSDWNIQIEVASNGREAVDKVKTEVYDVVLMDLQMPIMGGYEATKEIRKFNEDLPIIALTASAMEGIEAEVFASGMTDYVSKPFNPDDLYQKLKQQISKCLNKGAA